MSRERTTEYLVGLVRELLKLPNEVEWVEFKQNNGAPQDVGQYISALANSAALLGKPHGYLVWGVDNVTREIVGTSFAPYAEKYQSQELINWLTQMLEPKIEFRFYEIEVEGKRVVLLEVLAAFRHPVKFYGEEYIRVGTSKKKLKGLPEKERQLWRAFEHTSFESGVAAEHASDDDVLRLLDVPIYFDLLEQPLPDGRAAILEVLRSEQLIVRCEAGGWNITNLGAVMFAKKLEEFPYLKRKAVRVIVYKGTGRVETEREQVGSKGYAAGFQGLMSFIMTLIPANEVIGQAFRQTVPMYPELAVRELVANALIHQDFTVSGTAPMVELFRDRLEITNPGQPLVLTERFLDTPPRSRNEALASLMRRFRICEERGSGIDKVVSQAEVHQLPAPLFESPEGFTRATLFAHRPFADMDRSDRLRACYQHACLKWVQKMYLTNSSLRERFGIEQKNNAMVSRLIKDAVEEGLIVPYDADTSTRLMKYLPFWARQRGDGGVVDG